MSPLDGTSEPLVDPVAEAKIRALVAAYAYAVLTSDTELWLSLWQEREPLTDRTPGDPLTLDVDWARQVATRWGSLGTTVLHVTTHLIRHLGEGRAGGRVFCLAELDRPNSPSGSFVRHSIVYEDEYVRVGQSWRFATRRHLLWYGRNEPSPREQPPANWPESQVGRGVELAEELRPLATRPPSRS
ncbi:MAG TPA: nuclear transport factor 2 family protein [Solirubrobacteraceae bacterium]|nr:nuclear transport factor 2 family protein [Solirubrobacteraceae bacterium]